MTSNRRTLSGVWLGRRAYRPVLELQEHLSAERADGRGRDVVLLLEHEPVVTLGRGAHPENVLLGEDALKARGFDCVKTGRGGDVTLHAPGQLVCYPIVDLRPDRCDVRRYVKDLTETMRRVALHYGVSSGEAPGLIGLWADRERPSDWSGAGEATELAKIGAIGVRLSHWVTTHGFALNLTNAADLYSVIVPCGIRDHGVASIRELTGLSPDLLEAARLSLTALAEIMGAESDFRDASRDPLDAACAVRT